MPETEYLEPENMEEKKELVVSGGTYIEQAESMVIATERDYMTADDFLTLGREQTKKIEIHCDPRIAQANKLHKDLCKDKNVLLAPIKQATEIVKPKMRAFKREQEKKAQEEAARLRKIQLKEEADRQAKIDADKLAQAELLEKQGRKEEADTVLNAPDPMKHRPTPAPIAPPAIPKTKTQLRKDWAIEVVDFSKVPDDLKDFSHSRAKARVKAFDGKVEIPGCIVREI